MNSDFPVDIVYPWVDGNDQKWLEKKELYARRKSAANLESATDESRFRDNNELLYSLRSVDRYAPWVNRVFIVTDGQVPSFINLDAVTIVDHKDIFPSQTYLPSFNSNAIEMCLTQIKGLAEHFLLFNDDVMFGNKVSRSDFFDDSGAPVIWGVTEKRPMKDCLTVRDDMGDLDAAVANTRCAFMEKGYGFKPVKFRHTPKPIQKKMADLLLDTFPGECEKTFINRFRSRDDFIFSSAYCLLCLDLGVSRMVNIGGVNKAFAMLTFDLKHVETTAGNSRFRKRLALIRYCKPKTFCINDAEDTTEEGIRTTQSFLRRLFPDKSKFER